MTVTLSYDQAIRLAAWNRVTYARVFTIEGYAAKNGSNVEASVALATERGHELAGAIYAGSALTNSKAFHERDLERAASAYTLTHGEEVIIEGRRYRTHVTSGNERAPRHSDPIRFLPVRGEG